MPTAAAQGSTSVHFMASTQNVAYSRDSPATAVSNTNWSSCSSRSAGKPLSSFYVLPKPRPDESRLPGRRDGQVSRDEGSGANVIGLGFGRVVGLGTHSLKAGAHDRLDGGGIELRFGGLAENGETAGDREPAPHFLVFLRQE